MLPRTEFRAVFDASNEIIVEIHFGEGGADSKSFVDTLFIVYLKYAESLGFSAEVLDKSDGHVLVQFGGVNVWSAFKQELGKHAIQRCPKNDRSGRKHTSIVSVAILPLPP